MCSAHNKSMNKKPDVLLNCSVMHVTSLEKSIWSELKTNLVIVLARLDIELLFQPTVHLLYDYISCYVKGLHCGVFKQIFETEFCINTVNGHASIDELYLQEILEHGDRNIAKYCEDNGLSVILAFPQEGEDIISMSIPAVFFENSKFDTKLPDLLGYQLYNDEIEINSINYINTVIKFQTNKYKPQLPTLLGHDQAQKSFQNIFTQLNYDVISFSSIGEILAVSPSILKKLGMKPSELSIQAFKELIPTHFYNDVIWGLVLDDSNGKFENYRSRLSSTKVAHVSILFNVSGYRDENKVIHTLWQSVSFDEQENHKLSEGSILTEARVHNITRNYVPQLVEEKARETVRLGGNKLINEECNIAVLFCDIVGFTAYVEENESEESVIHTLNSIFDRISKSVKEYNGLIDKFMGDCVMVLFRNPYDAVIAAHKMQKHSADINHLRERAGQGTLKLRIGIHWGKVVIGNVGTPERLDWTTIGDVVNTASRIEKNCRPGAVLISELMQREIATEVHNDLTYGDTFYLEVKGKKDALAVCYTDLPE